MSLVIHLQCRIIMSDLRKTAKMSTKEILEREIKNHKTNKLEKRKRCFLLL